MFWVPRTRHHVPTEVAERAAAGFAATMRSELALVSRQQAALLLARRVIASLANHYGFDRIGPLLAAEGVYGTRELQGLFAEILANDQASRAETTEGPAQHSDRGALMTASQPRAGTAARFAVPGQPPRAARLGYEAFLDGHAVIRRLSRELPAAAADLMEIATTVYCGRPSGSAR